MARTHHLDSSQVHYEWNNALPPRLTIDPGDTVVFQTRDAADGWYTPTSTAADAAAKPQFRGHPLTGPIQVRGARAGGVLVVEIVDMKPAASFAYTQIIPGRGLLPEEFRQAYVQIWDLSDGRHARVGNRIAVPIDPFPGVMGVALDEPGSHTTMPPRKNGGNMDIKQLTAGTTLYLPVWVDGALFSVGDGHAAQGDGEVCINAVEMAAQVTLRFDLLPDRKLPEPRLRTRGPIGARTNIGPHYATTAHGPDLYRAAQQATRYMIDHLVEERGLSREEAYVVCSVAADLKISQIVDAPNWIVSAFLPESVFV
ncbi:MAG TPA: acetamidase/formamidase family protein [Methylomirabilota bacterium]|jgi:acetamidase/formamidase